MKELLKTFRNYTVDGILLIALGIFVLVWANNSVITIYRWIGIALIVMGACKGITFILKDKNDRSVPNLAVGIGQIIAGIVFIITAGSLVKYFPAVAAVLLGYGAVILILQTIKLRMGELKTFTASLVLGIISLVLAVIVFVHPVTLLNVMIQAAGIAMIFEGAAMIYVMSRKLDAGASEKS